MDLKIASLCKNKTWALVLCFEGHFEISICWVFKIKFGLDGRIIKYNAPSIVVNYYISLFLNLTLEIYFDGFPIKLVLKQLLSIPLKHLEGDLQYFCLL